MERSLKKVRLDKTSFEIFSSFEKGDAADRAYWHSRPPQEMLEALELMRQSAYGYDNPAALRLQRVLEVAQLKSS